jgi:hypothetical protein
MSMPDFPYKILVKVYSKMFGLPRAENLGRWVIHRVLEIIHWSSNHNMIYEFGKELIQKS